MTTILLSIIKERVGKYFSTYWSLIKKGIRIKDDDGLQLLLDNTTHF
jgi:hypothetical protein